MTEFAYRNYSQAELDLQYDTHRLVPGVSAYKARWAAASGQARRERSTCEVDIPYGALAFERLDVFPPETGPGPVEVFFHGGYWSRSDKLYYSFVGDALARRNVLAVIINYPLCPVVSMAELLDSCRKTVVWAYRNAEAFGGDPGRIFLSGYSAGAHIAAMLALTDWKRGFNLPADVVKGVSAVSGVYDLEPVTLAASNAAIGLTQDDVARFSPLHLPLGGHKPPYLIAGGGLESDEFRRQSTDYAQHLRDAGAPCELVMAPGHHHYSVLDALCNRWHPLGAALLHQLGSA